MLFAINPKNKVKKSKKSKLYYLLFLAVAAAALYLFINYQDILETGVDSKNNEVVLTAQAFVESVIYRDKEYQNLATGPVLFNLSGSERQGQKENLLNIKTEIETQGNNWATILVYAETENNNLVNINWYRLYMIYDESWKVYQLENINPVLKAEKQIQPDKRELVSVFTAFIEKLDTDYIEAESYLIGRARNNHNKAADILAAARLPVKISELTFESLFSTEEYQVAKFTYKINDNEVRVVVSFYKTREGWRIYEMAQS